VAQGLVLACGLEKPLMPHVSLFVRSTWIGLDAEREPDAEHPVELVEVEAGVSQTGTLATVDLRRPRPDRQLLVRVDTA
jgi:hypothetical protein